MSYDYDLIVIGAGPAGLAAAKRAASYGASVAVVEGKEPGGTCVNQGCVVEKLLAYAAEFANAFKYSSSYGWTSESSYFDWAEFIKTKDSEISRLNTVHLKKLNESGAVLLYGNATLRSANEVCLDGKQVVKARKILIAVGACPLKPQIKGINFAITTQELFNLPLQPKSIAILGNNYIALKAAQTLALLGAKVTLVFREPRVLQEFDVDLSEYIQAGMLKAGVQICPDTEVTEIELKEKCFYVSLNGVSKNILETGAVLCITKRLPNLEGVGLERLGLQLNEKSEIVVNERFETNLPSVCAIGDCIPNPRFLTPVATYEGNVFADLHFGSKQNINWKKQLEYIPISLSYQPEAASIGLTEADARVSSVNPVKCYFKEFQPLFHSLTECSEKSFIKIVTNSFTDEVLGLHMVGPGAIEIVQSVGLALKLGLRKCDLDSMIGIHPSSAEEFFSI